MNMNMNTKWNKITKSDHKFLSLAVNESKKSEMLMKHGCVLVKNGRIISRGYNNYRNKFGSGFMGEVCCCHAEMDAIHRAMTSRKLT